MRKRFEIAELQMLYGYWLENPPERFDGNPWSMMTTEYGKFWKACIAQAFWHGFDLVSRGANGHAYIDDCFEHAAWQAGRDWRRVLINLKF